MSKGDLIKTVKYNLKTKIKVIPIFGLYLLLLGAPIYVSIKSKNVFTTIFCLVFIIFSIWIILKNKAISYLTSVFKPAFAIYDKGLEINQKLFIEWNNIKEITVFEHFGEKHFGFRLKEELTTLNEIDVEKYFEKDLNWSLYKMPFVTSYNSLSPCSDEIINLIHSKFNVPITKQKISNEVKFIEP